MQTIELLFEGYWREIKKDDVPPKPGIYCVYTCEISNGKLSSLELIYIGESSNVNDRVANHERLPEWKELLNPGGTLCYSFANIASPRREIAEAAMIYKHQPLTNHEYKNDFPHETTTVKLLGKVVVGLCTEFTVNKA